MFIQSGGKRRAFAQRTVNLQDHLAQAGIFLLFTQAVQSLRNGNRRGQQRAHFAGEGGDFLAFDPAAKMEFALLRWGGGGRSPPFTRAHFELGGKNAAPAQQLQRGFAVLGFDHAAGWRSARFIGLVTEGIHSSKSPDETRNISSSVVTPADALRRASWCMVIIVICAAVLSSTLERFCKIS